MRHTFDRISPIAQYATVPRAFVFIQRINLGLYALLGELRATGNYRRMAEELWPFVDGAAVDADGRGRVGVARRPAPRVTAPPAVLPSGVTVRRRCSADSLRPPRSPRVAVTVAARRAAASDDDDRPTASDRATTAADDTVVDVSLVPATPPIGARGRDSRRAARPSS